MPKATVKTTQNINARDFLRSVNAEDLELQIAEAKKQVDEATGVYRSLLSLKRMIDFRDGKRKPWNRREPKAGKETPTVDEAADDVEEEEEDDETIGMDERDDKIAECLAKAKVPLTIEEIAQRLSMSRIDVRLSLNSDPLRFKVEGAGWRLLHRS